MTASLDGGKYVATSSFPYRDVTATAVGGERFAFGTDDGAVEIVAGDDRTTTSLDGAIVDVAVGARPYAIAGGEVVALSDGGTRVWSVTIEDARAATALPGPDLLVVRTDAELVGLDGETGTERFRTALPYTDVPDDPRLVGGEDAFAVVAWTFLTVLAADGEVSFEETFDATVEAAGVVDDAVVLALKNGRVVGVDVTDGSHRWERHLSVDALPECGRGALVFVAEGELRSLSADGESERLGEVPDGAVVATPDGDALYHLADGTATIYRDAAGAIDGLALAADDLAPGADHLAIEIRNDGEVPAGGSLSVRAEGLGVEDGSLQVDLAPGESTIETFPVEAAEAGTTATVRLEHEGQAVAETAVAVEERRARADLEASLSVDRVVDGIAHLGGRLANVGEEPTTGVVVEPGGRELGRLDGGESGDLHLEVPFEAGETYAVTVRADEPALEATARVELGDVPLAVDVVDAGDGFADVRVRNVGEVPVADRLLVDGTGHGELDRAVELEPGETLVLAVRLPAGEDRAVEATIRGLGADARERVSAPEAAGVEAAENRAVEAAVSDPSAEPDAVESRAEGPDAIASSASDDETDAPDSTDGSLTVRRSFSADAPAQTRRFDERVVVGCEADATDVRLRWENGACDLGDLTAGEEAALARRLAFVESGDQEVPACTVEAADAEPAIAEARSIAVEPADLAVVAAVRRVGDGVQVELAVNNRREVPCEIERVGVEGISIWRTRDFRIDPGASVEWSRVVEDTTVPAEPAVSAAVEYAFADGESTRWQTLAAVAGTTGGLGPLSVSVGPETRVAGEYGRVVLVIRNEGETPASEVSIVATGGAVKDLTYGGREVVPVLSPGEERTHWIDVDPGADAIELPVRIQATVGETRHAWEPVVAGPVAPTDEAWSEDLLDEWTVGGDSTAIPGCVSTAFERVEE